MSAFVHEIQIKSTGFAGGPGYTNFYFETAAGQNRDAQFAAVYAWLQGMKYYWPTGWSGQIQPAGRVLQTDTGILGEFSACPAGNQGAILGLGGGGYGPVMAGAVVGWNTATINRGRLVRGRTFIVPMDKGNFDSEGLISPTMVANFKQSADAFIAAAVGFCVWSRPRAGAGGLAAPVLTAHTTTTPAVLTSRRS